ncbi:hypothetical protein SteCoe_27741 [Stentor coeruleus]|uniref:Uncharacterized protein n=1 Tax=Stentor coeruleus TaxID=5963 RepID=A0A1R2B9T5_9CILI|nr:hypothetical protein SteCoe_27741 [Stentor coeruleus]
MEDKNFSWFLSELHTKKLPLKILEAGICRGSKLLDWYYTDTCGLIGRKPVKEKDRTKHLLNYFLNQRVPILEEYNPEKVICYLYHRKGVKIVTAKDAIELAENQLHGLQVRSIHMALPNSLNYSKVYKLTSWNEGGELQNQLTYGRITKDANEEVNDPVTYEKVLSLISYISDLIHKNYIKHIKTIKIDLTADSTNALHIIKITELCLVETFSKSDALLRGVARKTSLKILQESSEEVSEEDFDSGFNNPIKVVQEREQKKKANEYKIPLKKSVPQNSGVFLEMIAKTFDRDRKNIEYVEKIKNKRFLLEGMEKNNNRKLYQLASLKSPRENIPKKHALSNINDLLYYVEKTRPRIWLRDNGEEIIGQEIFPEITPQQPIHNYHSSTSSKAQEKNMKKFLSAAYLHGVHKYDDKSSEYWNKERQRILSKKGVDTIDPRAFMSGASSCMTSYPSFSSLPNTTKSKGLITPSLIHRY